MKTKLLNATIVLLASIVIFQWAMPAGVASERSVSSAYVIVAQGSYALTADGWIWNVTSSQGNPLWTKMTHVPVPVSDVRFLHGLAFTDSNGDYWQLESGTWANWGQPQSPPLPTSQKTLGGVKGIYR